MTKEECYKAFELMTIGMIEKNEEKLIQSMSIDSHLHHMTGLVETREEYIRDILNETLNYYDYEIISFDFHYDEAIVMIRLLAKVYGGLKSWWKLKMNIKFVEEDGMTKVQNCKVHIG
ncbi:MAG: hypothetical protein J1F32_03655 [Erysipelotrichales bacterium]|nr:hypothetical protein [Erysipelotrichales bacterium]